MENENNKKKQKTNKDLLNALSFFSQIGISIASCIIIGVFLGRFLDRVFGTSPWLLLVFSLLGSAAAIKLLFDMAKK